MSLKERYTDITYSIYQRWLRSYGNDAWSGNCAKINHRLAKTLTSNKIENRLVSGHYRSNLFGVPHNFPHTWVELPDGTILDAAAKLYGADCPLVLKENDGHYLTHR